MGEWVSRAVRLQSFAHPCREYHRAKAQWQELHGGPQGASGNRHAPEHWSCSRLPPAPMPKPNWRKNPGQGLPLSDGVQLKKLHLATFMPAWLLSEPLFWILIHLKEWCSFCRPCCCSCWSIFQDCQKKNVGSAKRTNSDHKLLIPNCTSVW